jgi:hypothetical protein
MKIFPASYESGIPFRSLRIHTAAVYCSDGRVGEQIDEFLRHALGSDLCDRLAVPGGPASLTSSRELPEHSKGVGDHLEFLVRAHDLGRVILITHVPCAFYREQIGVPDGSQDARQMGDLTEAARAVRAMGELQVDAFVARVLEERVRFHPVDV